MTYALFVPILALLLFGGSVDAAFWKQCPLIGSGTVNSVKIVGVTKTCQSDDAVCQFPKNQNVTLEVTFTPSSNVAPDAKLVGIMTATKQSLPFTSFPLENSIGTSNDFFGLPQLTSGSSVTYSKAYPTGLEQAGYTVNAVLATAPRNVIACVNMNIRVQ